MWRFFVVHLKIIILFRLFIETGTAFSSVPSIATLCFGACRQVGQGQCKLPVGTPNYDVKSRLREFFPYESSNSDGFKVAGRNSNQVIMNAESIAGLSREQLDGKDANSRSYRGLQTLTDGKESVRKTMLRDNPRPEELSLQRVITPLLIIMMEVEGYFGPDRPLPMHPGVQRLVSEGTPKEWSEPIDVQVEGDTYTVRARRNADSEGAFLPQSANAAFSGPVSSEGYRPYSAVEFTKNLDGLEAKLRCNIAIQISPSEMIAANYEVLVTRPDGETFFFEAATPHLAYRFGYFQSGNFRLEKSEIIKFFNMHY